MLRSGGDCRTVWLANVVDHAKEMTRRPSSGGAGYQQRLLRSRLLEAFGVDLPHFGVNRIRNCARREAKPYLIREAGADPGVGCVNNLVTHAASIPLIKQNVWHFGAIAFDRRMIIIEREKNVKTSF